MTSFFESLCHFVGCIIPFSLFERKKSFHTAFLPTQDTNMSPVSLREVHRVILDFSPGIRNTILIILFPLNVVEHWREDDQVLELIGLNVLSRQVLLDLSKNRQWWKSWTFPRPHFEFNCFSIESHRFLVRRLQPESYHLTSIASGLSFICPTQ